MQERSQPATPANEQERRDRAGQDTDSSGGPGSGMSSTPRESTQNSRRSSAALPSHQVSSTLPTISDILLQCTLRQTLHFAFRSMLAIASSISPSVLNSDCSISSDRGPCKGSFLSQCYCTVGDTRGGKGSRKASATVSRQVP